jgi:hypothetical protein
MKFFKVTFRDEKLVHIKKVIVSDEVNFCPDYIKFEKTKDYIEWEIVVLASSKPIAEQIARETLFDKCDWVDGMLRFEIEQTQDEIDSLTKKFDDPFYSADLGDSISDRIVERVIRVNHIKRMLLVS